MNRNHPAELLVYDAAEPCPYLLHREARMPLRLPTRKLSEAQFDRYLETGQRRSGVYLYRPQCNDCRACESIRVPVDHFAPNRTQRRVLRGTAPKLELSIGSPKADQARVDLFNAHRRERNLAGRDGEIDIASYGAFLVETCCCTLEMSYRCQDQLVAVAICDVGQVSMSAVYTYFDPRFSRLSPGAYSILKQIQWCRAQRKKYLYLGYFVDGSAHMSYKANYLPHERLIGGQWQPFSKSET